jgi:YesN/AraC family two-component response regulator
MINPAYYILKSLLISATVTLSLGLFLAIILSFWQSRPLKPIIELCNQTGAGGVDAYGAIQGTLTKLLSMVEDRDLKLERILPQLRDDFILWLLTKLPADKGEIDDRMLFLQVSFPYRNFCVIVVKTTADEMQVEHSMAYAKLTLQQVFNTEHSMCGFFRKDGLLLGLVNYDYPYDDTVALSRTVLDQNAEGDCQYYYSVAHLHDDLSALATMITQMIESLKYSFLYPEKHFYVPEFAAVMNQKNDEDDKNQLMSFYNALRNYDKDNAETRLRDIFENLRKDGCNLDRLYAIIMKLTSEIESFFGSRPHLQRELAQLVDETPDILHFTHSLCEIIDEEIQTKREQYPLSSVELVEGAVAYIGNHLLDNQLSLPIVASELSVNPNYLSNIFHKVKGMTFVEYITGEKINYGRELLLETDLNLREISVKLNYASPQYFISRFKKQFRITPSVYRERHRTNGDDCTGAKSFTQ